jgi:hypothetical protein
LLSKTLSLCSSLKVRNQVSHPYSTTDKIIVLLLDYYIQVIINRKETVITIIYPYSLWIL